MVFRGGGDVGRHNRPVGRKVIVQPQQRPTIVAGFNAKRIQADVKTLNIAGKLVVRLRPKPANVGRSEDAVDSGLHRLAFRKQRSDENE
jgi:hypothetical protein